MKIQTARESFRNSNKKLRRARRLYVLFVRKNITNTMQLEFYARRMRDSGLYATDQVRDITFAILRTMWRLDGGRSEPYPNPNDWHRWAHRNGWDIAHRAKVEAIA